ncbi:hypothetical protein E4U31_007870, partial [Claviceps sp. LM219 group G6]
MPPANLQKWFPWTKAPLICNGPMINAATPKLATEVSKAGGLGKYIPTKQFITSPHLTHAHVQPYSLAAAILIL